MCDHIAYCERNELKAEIDRLRAELAGVKSLLTDKTYIQCKTDYYRGHLSHANYLNERECAAFNPTVGGMED